MACVNVTGGFVKIKEKLPDGVDRIFLKDLSIGEDLERKFILVHIVKKCQLCKNLSFGSLMKLIIKEGEKSDEEELMGCNLFLMGDYAENLQHVQVGDVLCMVNVKAEERQSENANIYGYSLFADSRCPNASFWISSTPPSQGETSTTSYNLDTNQRTIDNVQPKNIRHYNYTKLSDAKIGSLINVYAVVKFFKPPKMTRGTDYSMVLILTDPSLVIGDKLKCILFSKDVKSFPAVKAEGDILRLHRLKITEFRDERQGQMGPGFSSLRFESALNGSEVPETNSSTYTFTPQDTDMIRELRKWFNENKEVVLDLPKPCEGPAEHTFADTILTTYFDITCQVVAKCKLDETAILLRCCDGTKSKNRFFEAKLTEEEQRGLEVNVELEERAKDMIYDVFVYDDHVITLSDVKPGDYLSFTNLHAMKHKVLTASKDPALVELTLHKGTSHNRGVRILPSDSPQLENLKKRLGKDIPALSEGAGVVDQPRSSISDGQQNSSAKNTESSYKSPNKLKTSSGIKESDDVSPSKRSKATPRAVAKNRTRPQLTSIETDTTLQPDLRVVTIKSAKKLPTPSKFKLDVRLVSYEPKIDEVEQLVRLYCPGCDYVMTAEALIKDMNPKPTQTSPLSILKDYLNIRCPHYLQSSSQKSTTAEEREESKLELMMLLRLLVTDSSDCMVVHVTSKELATFLQVNSPEDVLRDGSVFKRVQAQLETLCPTRSNAPHPLFKCCIKSFLNDSNEFYQMFDTILL